MVFDFLPGDKSLGYYMPPAGFRKKTKARTSVNMISLLY